LDFGATDSFWPVEGIGGAGGQVVLSTHLCRSGLPNINGSFRGYSSHRFGCPACNYQQGSCATGALRS
jgi:hypothetical protein